MGKLTSANLKMTITTTGKSLWDMKDEIWQGSTWWHDEPFAKEHPPAREYEIDFERKHTSKTYQEQLESLDKDWEPMHPAVLMEAILIHHKATGEWLLNDWYSRTSSVGRGGGRVSVGRSGGGRPNVHGWDGNGRDDRVGLAASRKFKSETGSLGALDTLEPLELSPDTQAIVGAIDKLTKAVGKLSANPRKIRSKLAVKK